MRKIVAIMIVLIPLVSGAQTLRAPDDHAIFNEINQSASPFYYPFLMARYMAGDRALSQEDYFYLYYGYAMQESYKPLEPLPEVDNILIIMEKTPEPDSLGCRQIIANGQQVMLRDPFSPTNLNLMAYAYTILGDTASARTYALRVEHVLQTIKSSGRGTSEGSPWVILAFSHGEDLLSSMNLQAHSRRVVSRSVEYIDIGRRDERIKGYFFDYSRIYWNKPETMAPERPRGWEINGIKIK